MNILALAAAAFSNFLLGGLWYSPLLFGNLWQKESGISPQEIKSQGGTPYLFALIYSFVSAIGFSFFVEHSLSLNQNLIVALITGSLLVAPSLGTNYQFSGKSMTTFFIDAGFHITRFVIYALVFWYL